MSTLTLSQDEVHLWWVNLELSAENAENLAYILSEKEKERAKRFHFLYHQHRFIAARSALRIILGRYLNLNPQKIEFTYSDKGKPSIANLENHQRLEFNLSHSQTLALCGITSDRPIGVDIEQLRPMKDAAQLAQRFFCPSEFAVISPLPPGEQEKAFFRAWTAKEAFLKATGEGLSGGLDQVEVDLLSDVMRLRSIKGEVQPVKAWSILSLIGKEDYLGAVVVKDKFNFQQFQLDLTNLNNI